MELKNRCKTDPPGSSLQDEAQQWFEQAAAYINRLCNYFWNGNSAVALAVSTGVRRGELFGHIRSRSTSFSPPTTAVFPVIRFGCFGVIIRESHICSWLTFRRT